MIRESKYKDQKAICLESNTLKVKFLPQIGAKMASLIYKPLQKELLTQRDGDNYKKQKYDGNYLQGEGRGFDDMFPNIDESYYDRYPWKGTLLPDHGEVWQLPWKYEVKNNTLYCSVNGIRLPYILEKQISFVDDDTLRIDYKLTNPTPFEMDFIWAAHLMLNAEPGDTIELDDKLKKGYITYCHTGLHGRYGDLINYPLDKDINGEDFRTDIITGPERGDFLKFYFLEKMDKGYCRLNYQKIKKGIEFTFPADEVPYMALLHNSDGGGDIIDLDGVNFYFEPCTAPYDSTGIARLHNKQSVLKPYEVKKWYLTMSVYDI